MDHGDHGGHGGHDMPGGDHGGGMDHGDMKMCAMNMSFHWDPSGICLVFPFLQISSRDSASFPLSLLLIFTIGVLYEYSRKRASVLDKTLAELKRSRLSDKKRDRNAGLPDLSASDESLLGRGRVSVEDVLDKRTRALRSLWYVLNVAISFYLMLIIMSYNGFLILAVLAGGFVGHFAFFSKEVEAGADAKGMSCH
ncbi:Ctr-domain-containing protein [Atractiella rhizophila]|nr:Ctr-domain-containing protein [Atractiella rhizophila]